MSRFNAELTTWAKQNDLGENILKMFEQNGLREMDHVKNLSNFGLDNLGLNGAEETKLQTALNTLVLRKREDISPLRSSAIATKERFVSEPISVSESLVTRMEAASLDETDGIDKMKQDSKVTHGIDNMAHYKLKVRVISESKKEKVRRCEHGEAPEMPRHRSILVIGETGSGKSTMINAIINYICNVPVDGGFRFHLSDNLDENITRQSVVESLTDWITCYTFHPPPGSKINYTLNIVDTPGFGDTRGMQRDKQICDQIKELFESRKEYGLDSLYAVCFVVKANTNRLTPNQRYIIDSVMAIFGKNLKENIFILCSHHDGTAKEIIENNMRSCEVPYCDLFVTNNKWMQDADAFSKLFFGTSQENLKQFLERVNTVKPKSLQMSVEVLHERKELEETSDSLQRLLSSTTGQLDEIMKKRKLNTKPYGVLPPVEEVGVMETVKTGEKNMNCYTCQATCKMYVVGMFMKKIQQQSKCQICQCNTSDHVFESCRFQWLKKKTLKPSRDADLSKNEMKLVKSFRVQMRKMQETMSSLRKIALKPHVLDMEDYIEMALQQEQMEGKVGWQERVKMLRKLKENYKIIANITDSDYHLLDLLNY